MAMARWARREAKASAASISCADWSCRPAGSHGNCRRRHGRRSARRGRSRRCPPASPRRSRRGARSARRRRWRRAARRACSASLRPKAVVARLPELRALLRASSPRRNCRRHFRRRSRRSARACSGDARLRAVELDEQHRRLGQAQLGVGVEGAHRQRVEQLDARDRQAGLDGLRSSRCRPSARRGTSRLPAEIASGMPDSRSVISMMTPSVPSAPTKRCVRS